MAAPKKIKNKDADKRLDALIDILIAEEEAKLGEGAKSRHLGKLRELKK